MPSQPKILICDTDEAAVRALAKEARAGGWAAMVQTAARAVIPLAVKHRPDLIVLDVDRPTEGRQLLAALRQDPRTSGLRMVLSGEDRPGLRRECLELGADAFVGKPVKFSDLLFEMEAEAEADADAEEALDPDPDPDLDR